jgi:hypothetical protein
VLDRERKRYRKSDLPVFRSRHAGFGDLSLDPSALNVYAFIGYIPNTNLMDGGPDYGRMFITKDRLCEGTKWHTRVVPADPATDPYFPIGQAALSLVPDGAGLRVALKTLTPNFKTYLARIDGGEWKAVGEAFTWTPLARSRSDANGQPIRRGRPGLRGRDRRRGRREGRPSRFITYCGASPYRQRGAG